MSHPDIKGSFDGVRWVWFDLDDTLFDFHRASREALLRLYREERLDRFYLTPEGWTEAYMKVNHGLWDLYNCGQISQQRLRTDRFRIPLAQTGIATEVELDALATRFDSLYLDMLSTQKALMPEAAEVLLAVREAGFHTGILSNGFTHAQHTKIRTNGLEGLIDAVVLSDDIGVNKPDRRLFDYAMTRAGEPDPESHLMVGDNPATDIAGALAAGWKAILFSPVPHAQAPDPTDVPQICRLRDVLPLLGAV